MKNNFFDQQMIMEIKQRYDPRRWTTTQDKNSGSYLLVVDEGSAEIDRRQ